MPIPPVKVTIGNETKYQREWAKEIGITPEALRWRINKCKEEGLDLTYALKNEYWLDRASKLRKQNAGKPVTLYETKYGLMSISDMAEFCGRSLICIKQRMQRWREGEFDIDTVLDNSYFARIRREGRKRGGKIGFQRQQKNVNLSMREKIEQALNAIPEPSTLERKMEKLGWL